MSSSRGPPGDGGTPPPAGVWTNGFCNLAIKRLHRPKGNGPGAGVGATGRRGGRERGSAATGRGTGPGTVSLRGWGGALPATLGLLENGEKRTLKVPVWVPEEDGLQRPRVRGWGAARACPEAEQGGGLVLRGQLEPSRTGGRSCWGGGRRGGGRRRPLGLNTRGARRGTAPSSATGRGGKDSLLGANSKEQPRGRLGLVLPA